MVSSSSGNRTPLLLARQIPTPFLLNHVLWLEAQAEAAASQEARAAYWDAYERLVEILRGVTTQGAVPASPGPVHAEVLEITAEPGPAESIPALRLRRPKHESR